MKHSTFRQPLPAALEPLMSKGYTQSHRAKPEKFEIVGPAPAGSLSSPGEDMAHFMIAHLQNGEYNGNRILKAETAKQMHDSPLTLLPPLNRMELGFFETNINGREVIAHLGDIAVLPHLAASVPEREHRLLRLVQQRRAKQVPRSRLRLALFAGFRRSLFPGGDNGDDARRRADRCRARAMMAGNWVELARLAVELLLADRPDRAEQSRSRREGRAPGSGIERSERRAAALGRDRAVRLAGRERTRAAGGESGRRQSCPLQLSTCSRRSWCSTALPPVSTTARG